MRLFIAVRFEDDIIRALTDVQNAMREHGFSGRYTMQKNLHMTLSFIGEYADPDNVLQIMQNLSGEPFTLHLRSGLGHFGDLLWAGAEQSDALMTYVERLRNALDEGCVPHDRQPFVPHITLLQRARSWAGLSEIAVAQKSMKVQRLTLMRSDLCREDGGIYREVGSAEIGKTE